MCNEGGQSGTCVKNLDGGGEAGCCYGSTWWCRWQGGGPTKTTGTGGVDMLSTKGSGFETHQGMSDRLANFNKMQSNSLNESRLLTEDVPCPTRNHCCYVGDDHDVYDGCPDGETCDNINHGNEGGECVKDGMVRGVDCGPGEIMGARGCVCINPKLCGTGRDEYVKNDMLGRRPLGNPKRHTADTNNDFALEESKLRRIIKKTLNESQLLVEHIKCSDRHNNPSTGENVYECGRGRTCARAEYSWEMECQDMSRIQGGGSDDDCCLFWNDIGQFCVERDPACDEVRSYAYDRRRMDESQLLTERKYQCYSRGKKKWHGGKGDCVHSSSILSTTGRPSNCSSPTECEAGMVIQGGDGTVVKGGGKTKYSKHASKHITMKESDLINIIRRTINESQILNEREACGDSLNKRCSVSVGYRSASGCNREDENGDCYCKIGNPPGGCGASSVEPTRGGPTRGKTKGKKYTTFNVDDRREMKEQGPGQGRKRAQCKAKCIQQAATIRFASKSAKTKWMRQCIRTCMGRGTFGWGN